MAEYPESEILVLQATSRPLHRPRRHGLRGAEGDQGQLLQALQGVSSGREQGRGFAEEVQGDPGGVRGPQQPQQEEGVRHPDGDQVRQEMS